MGPDVGEVGAVDPVELGVMRGLFAEKVGTMGGVKFRVAEPAGVGKACVVGHVRGDLFSASVVEPAPFPFVADCKAIDHERCDVPAPHFDGGVILPAIGRVGEGVEDLQRFDALLSQTSIV